MKEGSRYLIPNLSRLSNIFDKLQECTLHARALQTVFFAKYRNRSGFFPTSFIICFVCTIRGGLFHFPAQRVNKFVVPSPEVIKGGAQEVARENLSLFCQNKLMHFF